MIFAINGHYQTKSYTAITFLPTDHRRRAYWVGDVSVTYNHQRRNFSVMA